MENGSEKMKMRPAEEELRPLKELRPGIQYHLAWHAPVSGLVSQGAVFLDAKEIKTYLKECQKKNPDGPEGLYYWIEDDEGNKYR
ncbi:MAG: hypothetical protein KGH93_00345 [Patescibacteria group bacterium]|nr:hypothetical protein [Patescibacteria group bacterium]MDE1945641.1 hypothetical protein [Patescibacteria group bacterium]